MSALTRLWRNRGALLEVLDFLEKAAKGVKDLNEYRARIAAGAHAGDLDDVLKKFADTTSRADDFIENG